ncbi:MAG: IPT/TIG domain-containing protein [Chloroflexota bacterium]
MKFTRFLRLLGTAAVLSLLMAAIPLAPVMAANDIVLSIAQGEIGNTVTVTGSSFTVGTQERQARIIFSPQPFNINNLIGTDVTIYRVMSSANIRLSDEASPGTFSTSFQIPSTVTNYSTSTSVAVSSGTYYVYVTITTLSGESQTIVSKATLTVIGGAITLDPEEGTVDYPVEITGQSFAANTNITIEFGGDKVDIDDGDTKTNSSGNFESFFIVPEARAGKHTVTVTIGGSVVEAEFTVEPDVIISPQSGEAGVEVTISGTGFARRPRQVNIYFNNNQVTAETMDSNGSFSAKFFVPEGLTAGVFSIEAEDEDDNLAKASFTLNVAPAPAPTPEPTPTPTPTPKPSTAGLSINQSGNFVGSLIGIGGAGFTPKATITVKYDDKEVTTSTADDLGVFIVTFAAPPSKGGDHIVTASDGTNTAEITYTVESDPPSIPQPLMPEMGVKAKSPVTFDWEDVTDDSRPVIYTLQIATDEDFDGKDIVLEKTDLEKSTYVLTEAEELKLAGEKTSYFWRVRAVDGASNASEWTGAGEFSVAGPLAFPDWALYTILGIGAVLIFIIGYWLGRRAAWSY